MHGPHRYVRHAAAVLAAGAATGAGYVYWAKVRHSGQLASYAGYLTDTRAAPADDQVKVTYLGSTTLLAQAGAARVLIDAYLSPVTLLDAVLRRKVSTDARAVAALLDRAGAGRLDAIFLSHSHYDHVFDVAAIAARTGALVYGSPSTLNVARGGGIPEQQLRPLDLTQPVTLGGLTVQALASRHSPNPIGGEGTPISVPLHQPATIYDYKEGGTYDFLLRTPTVSMLFKNSANWIPGALDGITADVLFLAIAGLGNAGDGFSQGFLDATVGAVQPALVVPTHWNDFFCPIQTGLPMQRELIDHIPTALDRLHRRLTDTHIGFAILDAFSSLITG